MQPPATLLSRVMPTAIDIAGLTKSFGPGSLAVAGISLAINPGELFFLLGPSGCGKTTLLRMIAGFIEPTSGTIRFDGRDVTATPPNRRNTGMVFQSYALWPHMTVEQNVAFGLQLRKTPAAERSRRIAEALAAVHMSEYAARKPNQLSGGQQQRVALARALVIRPHVLLLDEPLSNLDAKLRIELRSEIRRICKNQRPIPPAPGPSGPPPDAAASTRDADPPAPITTVYVTHDQKEALSMADRIAVLNRGRVVALGTPRDLYRRPPSRFVAEFLGETNFIPCTASGPGRLDTPAGPLSTSAPMPPAPRIIASIRPEAFRIVPDGAVSPVNPAAPDPSTLNLLPARILESTYLGEIAQHTAELQGGIRVKIADLNPAPDMTRPDPIPRPIRFAVSPDDVVVLPDDER